MYFDAIADGRKTFEIRKDDRGFNPGDVLELREFAGEYTGRSLWRHVTYITDYEQKPGYVVMAILPTRPQRRHFTERK